MARSHTRRATLRASARHCATRHGAWRAARHACTERGGGFFKGGEGRRAPGRAPPRAPAADGGGTLQRQAAGGTRSTEGGEGSTARLRHRERGVGAVMRFSERAARDGGGGEVLRPRAAAAAATHAQRASGRASRRPAGTTTLGGRRRARARALVRAVKVRARRLFNESSSFRRFVTSFWSSRLRRMSSSSIPFFRFLGLPPGAPYIFATGCEERASAEEDGVVGPRAGGSLQTHVSRR